MTKTRVTTKEIIAQLALLERGFKYCKNCGLTKPVDKFGKDPRHTDGLQTFCRECQNLLKRTKWGDKIRAYGRDYHQKHKAQANKRKCEYMQKNRKRFEAKHKSWLAINREHVLQTKKAYHAAHREDENEQAKIRAKEWRLKNPEKFYANVLRRQARLAQAEGCHTRDQWLKLLELCGNVCVFCGSVDRITRDHVIPLDWGGSDRIENIQPLCKSCNSIKRHYYAVDYRPSLARAWAGVESVAWVGDGL